MSIIIKSKIIQLQNIVYTAEDGIKCLHNFLSSRLEEPFKEVSLTSV